MEDGEAGDGGWGDNEGETSPHREREATQRGYFSSSRTVSSLVLVVPSANYSLLVKQLLPLSIHKKIS
jgi:hypothetical protein